MSLLRNAKDWTVRHRGSGEKVHPRDSYQAVAILGQSNALGCGIGAPTAPHPMVHQWPGSGRTRGAVVTGVDPLFHHTPARGVGFGTTFGRELATSTGTGVLLIPAARGESGFTPIDGHTWDPRDRTSKVNLFDFASTQIESAVALPNTTLTAVLWHQGESDVPHMDGAQYSDALDALVHALRERFGAVPFLVGQMSPDRMAEGHANYPVINAVHASIAERHALSSFVEGPVGLFNSDEEKIHYSAAGQRELGTRMWNAYRKLAD
ncbi:hypothetical protein CH298_13520 [Rhodococcoides fascians]|uniref:sialate O-acetylesterase n=1 Tax=Rhodococcoides fascians TaxID=1828 RepID=UPI000B9C6A28|nr:sialate O-acetylesterase [Rhodococcus fascians]OZE89996.1 hypothetical protein CH303_13400 [Rhodococcus fascians]OZF18303.1 hypothetical protein CH298_13520 [Rhodococcus fascians]OZF21754.1 hypothetical protein CH297_13415 [Rhodococcus fascians]OZF67379.1 hypothetical protein CH308_13315 [Rhodococcus fascians]OZF70569.1 hypothetical protein CH307_13510 [Rhodococcus fascians]